MTSWDADTDCSVTQFEEDASWKQEVTNLEAKPFAQDRHRNQQ